MSDRRPGHRKRLHERTEGLSTSDHREAPKASDGTGRLDHIVRWLVLRVVWLVANTFTRGKIRVFGTPPADPGLVVFHHNSPLDAIIIAHPMWRAGHTPIAMVKAGVFRNAFIGPLVRPSGMIPVARGMAEGRSAAYDAAVGHLKRGHTVYLAPSGSLSQTQVVEPEKWRIGGARMALEAGVSITPALILGPQRWGGNGVKPLKFHRVPCDIWIGEPVEIDEDPHVTTDRVSAAMTVLLDKAYDEYPEPGPGKWWWPANRGGDADEVEAAA